MTAGLTPTTIQEYDRAAPGPDETETVTFGLGCFWGPEADFGALEGVVRTRVGYAGGTKSNPSYHTLGDHTEVVQVDIDPTVVSYRDVLEAIFQRHDPHRQVTPTQYQHVVFAATDSQRTTLDSFLSDRGLDPGEIGTRVVDLEACYLAEPYHQKHSLRATPDLLTPFETAEYDDEALRESPAAATLNGLAAGNDLPADDEFGMVEARRARFR